MVDTKSQCSTKASQAEEMTNLLGKEDTMLKCSLEPKPEAIFILYEA